MSWEDRLTLPWRLRKCNCCIEVAAATLDEAYAIVYDIDYAIAAYLVELHNASLITPECESQQVLE